MPTEQDFAKFRFYQCYRDHYNNLHCDKVSDPNYIPKDNSRLQMVSKTFPEFTDKYFLYGDSLPLKVIIHK